MAAQVAVRWSTGLLQIECSRLQHRLHEVKYKAAPGWVQYRAAKAAMRWCTGLHQIPCSRMQHRLQ